MDSINTKFWGLRHSMKWEGVRDGSWMEFFKKLVLERETEGERETSMRDDRLPPARPLVGIEHITLTCALKGVKLLTSWFRG